MRELLTIPNDILRTPCKPVENIDSEVKALASDLAACMFAHCEDSVPLIGLAAPQLGESIRVFAFYPNPIFRERRAVEVLINPKLDKLAKFAYVTETCLSVPGKQFCVRRARRAKIRGINLDGEPRTYKGTGLLAQVFQHEVDHLNGVLIDSIGQLIRG